MMLDPSVKIIAARRAYEFGADDLRLTMLSIRPMQERITQLFGFQQSSIGSPRPTFGPVIQALPPGLSFEIGAVQFPQGAVTPIRFLFIEPTRIVMDVAGSSEAIDAAFTTLKDFLRDITAPDGSAVIGPVKNTLEFSALTMQLPFAPRQLVNPLLWPAFDRLVRREGVADRAVSVPLIRIALTDTDGVYPTTVDGDEPMYSLELRAGTNVDDRTYHSLAPLNSEKHLAMLIDLSKALNEPLSPKP